MNLKEQLKSSIVNANKAYRSGTAIMSDEEFDALVDQYEKLCENDEFVEFKDSLHEVGGKIKHPYVLGSLNKLKASEPQLIEKFMKENISHKLNISAKVDGLSCRLHYENGKLVSASTRGDGSFGIDLTDKTSIVKFIPQSISATQTLDIRGELVILKTDFAAFESEFANPRNAVAGLINRKEWNADDISRVSFIAYTVLGPEYSKHEQFELLGTLGFTTAWNTEVDSATVEQLTEWTLQGFDYENDGLVISDSEYHNEDQYRPNAQVAFKVNQQTAITTILDVAFDGPSKNGIHAPVALLDPVEIGGVIVSRVTLYNLDYIEEMDLRYGSVVEILRSGDVIPKIIRVVDNPENASAINLPLICNCCGEKLVKDGVHLRCVNKDCKDQRMHRLAAFIVNLGIKGATEKTLENLGISSIEDLLEFQPNSGYKTQMKLQDELKSKLFTRSKQDLLAAMCIQDVGSTLINKIVDFYGMDNVEAGRYLGGLPSGIGETTLQKFQNEVMDNLNDVNMIIKDRRYCYSEAVTDIQKKSESNGLSICFTGKLNTMGRTEAEKKAQAAGFKINGVNKKLTYLVTNDPTTNSGKGKKARELGIKIISEVEFLKMVEVQQSSVDGL